VVSAQSLGFYQFHDELISLRIAWLGMAFEDARTASSHLRAGHGLSHPPKAAVERSVRLNSDGPDGVERYFAANGSVTKSTGQHTAVEQLNAALYLPRPRMQVECPCS
jgi:hypothetical protein